MPPRSWALSSDSGRESVRWEVREVSATDLRVTLTCDVHIEGQYFGAALGGSTKSPDYHLVLEGLALDAVELERLTRHLGEWLALPPAEQARHRPRVVCNVGSLFDQSLTMTLGDRDDTLSGGKPVATFRYIAGRLIGEVSFVTDQSCLRLLCEGIDSVLSPPAEPLPE